MPGTGDPEKSAAEARPPRAKARKKTRANKKAREFFEKAFHGFRAETHLKYDPQKNAYEL